MKKGFLNIQKKKRVKNRLNASVSENDSVASHASLLVKNGPQKPPSAISPVSSDSTRQKIFIGSRSISQGSWKKGFLISNKVKERKGHSITKGKKKNPSPSMKKKTFASLLFLEDDADNASGAHSRMSLLLNDEGEIKTSKVSQTPIKSKCPSSQTLCTKDDGKKDRVPKMIYRPLVRLAQTVDKDDKILSSYDGAEIASKPCLNIIKDVTEKNRKVDRNELTERMVVNDSSSSIPLQVAMSTLLVNVKKHCKSQAVNGKADIDDITLKGYLDAYLKYNLDENRKTVLFRIHFFWDSILESIAVHANGAELRRVFIRSPKRVPSTLQISSYLLKEYPEQSIHALLDVCAQRETVSVNSQEEVKRKKVKMLGMFVVIRYHIQEMHRSLQKSFQSFCKKEEIRVVMKKNYITSELLKSDFQLAIKGSIMVKKKSIISVTAMHTYYCLLEYSSLLYQMYLFGTAKSCVISDLEYLSSLIWLNFPLLKEIVQFGKNLETCEGADSIFEGARHMCSIAVLNDWLHLFTRVQNIYDRLKLCEDKDACNDAVGHLTRELAGVSLEDICNFTSDSVPTQRGRIEQHGGIAQTLCRQATTADNCFFDELISKLRTVKQQDYIDLDEFPLSKGTSIMTMRSICAGLGRTKNFGEDSNSSKIKMKTEAADTCMYLLRSKSQRFLDLVVAVLNGLWSSNDGLPNDSSILNDSEELQVGSSSLHFLMREIASYETTKMGSDPSQKVICALFQRFLLDRPMVLLPFFLSQAKFNATEIYLLISILEQKTHHRKVSKELCLIVEEKLLSIFENSTALQEKVLQNIPQDLFSSIPLDVAIPRFLHILQTNEASASVSCAASKILTQLIEQNASSNSAIIVAQIISFLETAESEKLENNNLLGLPKCLKYARIWRSVLLSSVTCDDCAFASILVACGNAMFASPSSTVMLNVFGAFVGEGKEATDDVQTTELCYRRILNSVVALVKMGITRLGSDLKRIAGEASVYERLSPLLMLRRIPSSFFQLSHRHLFESEHIFEELAFILEKKLRGVSETLSSTTASAEELRLLADIAAISLPFSTTRMPGRTLSAFQVFCEEPISSSLQLFSVNPPTIGNWKALKVAFYIGCKAVQIAPKNISSTDYTIMIDTALTLLFTQNGRPDSVQVEWVDVQAGCIDFLATCICAMFVFPHDSSTHLNEDVPYFSNPNESFTSRQGQSEQDQSYLCLSNLLAVILNLINGMAVRHSYFERKPYSPYSQRWTCERWSVLARICLSNILVVAAQRCRINQLSKFSKAIIPALTTWLNKGSIGDTIRQPLCVASVMQCVFVCLQRTLYFSSFQIARCSAEVSVRGLFCLSLHIIERQSKVEKLHEQNQMRMAAVKVLITILSINRARSEVQTLSTCAQMCDFLLPADIRRAQSALSGIANLDECADLRKLAASLLSFVQTD